MIMPTIKRFEDIEVWQDARKFVALVYTITARGAFAKDFSLRDQLRCSSVSVVSNIAEGFERKGRNEFIHFLYIAKASAGEMRSQLYTALDLAYVNQNAFSELSQSALSISGKLANFIKYLEGLKTK
jgi:four helix bundle protein